MVKQLLPIKTAGSEDVPYLYHYEKFCPAWMEGLLRDCKIYLSHPETFNDPWDCHVAYSNKVTDENRQQLITWLLSQANPAPRDVLDDDQNIVRLIDDISEGMRKTIKDDGAFRVYCLSECARNPLMWAHYANSHKGICLKFRGFKNACKVQYPREPLQQAINDAETLPGGLPSAVVRILAVKADYWRYEREYRLIVSKNKLQDQSYQKIRPDALCAIIVGLQMPVEHRRKLKALVDLHRPGVEILEARRVENSYGLEIRPWETTAVGVA